MMISYLSVYSNTIFLVIIIKKKRYILYVKFLLFKLLEQTDSLCGEPYNLFRFNQQIYNTMLKQCYKVEMLVKQVM